MRMIPANCAFLTLGLIYAVSYCDEKTAYDFSLDLRLTGQVCDGRYKWDDCLEVGEALISVGDKRKGKSTPLDFTNWEGRFVLDDRLHYGFTLNSDSGEVVSGSIDVDPYLSVSKPGFKEVRISLRSISSGSLIESASPLCIVLQPAGSVGDGTAGFSPSQLIPTLPNPPDNPRRQTITVEPEDHE